MTRAFNDEKVCKNLYGFIGEDENLTVRSSVQSHWNGSSHFQKTAVCQRGLNEVHKKNETLMVTFYLRVVKDRRGVTFGMAVVKPVCFVNG